MKSERQVSSDTRMKLKNAFIELCAENGLSSITVSKITKKTKCNRCTFYNYYEDIPALLSEIEDEILQKIQQHFEKIIAKGDTKVISDFFPDLFSSFSAYGEIMFILIGEGGDVAFREKMYRIINPYQRKLIGQNINDDALEYISSFISSSALGLIEQWYRSNKKLSLEEFFKLSQFLLFNGVGGIIQSSTNNIDRLFKNHTSDN